MWQEIFLEIYLTGERKKREKKKEKKLFHMSN